MEVNVVRILDTTAVFTQIKSLYSAVNVAEIAKQPLIDGVPLQCKAFVREEFVGVAVDATLYLFDQSFSGCNTMLSFDSNITCLDATADGHFAVVGTERGSISFVYCSANTSIYNKKGDGQNRVTALKLVECKDGTHSVFVSVSNMRVKCTNFATKKLHSALSEENFSLAEELMSELIIKVSPGCASYFSVVESYLLATVSNCITIEEFICTNNGALGHVIRSNECVDLLSPDEESLPNFVKTEFLPSGDYLLALSDLGELHLFDVNNQMEVGKWDQYNISDFQLIKSLSIRSEGEHTSDLCQLAIIRQSDENDMCSTTAENVGGNIFEIRGFPSFDLMEQMTTSSGACLASVGFTQDFFLIIDPDRERESLFLKKIEEIDPADKLNRYIGQYRFKEAKELALMFNLDDEIIHLHEMHYTLQHSNGQSVIDCLMKIKNVMSSDYIVDNCLQATLQTFQLQLDFFRQLENKLNNITVEDHQKEPWLSCIKKISHSMKRLLAFSRIYNSTDYSPEKWSFFHLADISSEFFKFLQNGETDRAFLIWTLYKGDLISTMESLGEPCVALICQQFTNFFSDHDETAVQVWMRTELLPAVIAYLPLSLPELVRWFESRVLLLETSEQWPHNAIHRIHLVLSSVHCYPQSSTSTGEDAEQLSTENSNLVTPGNEAYTMLAGLTSNTEGVDPMWPLRQLILDLRSIGQLNTKYNFQISLANYRKETVNSIAYRMTDRLGSIGSFLDRQIRNYLEDNGISEQNFLSGYVTDLLSKKKVTTSYNLAGQWETGGGDKRHIFTRRAVSVIARLTSPFTRLRLTVDLCQVASTPWPDELDSLVNQCVQLNHSLVSSLVMLQSKARISPILRKYQIQADNLSFRAALCRVLSHIIPLSDCDWSRCSALMDSLTLAREVRIPAHTVYVHCSNRLLSCLASESITVERVIDWLDWLSNQKPADVSTIRRQMLSDVVERTISLTHLTDESIISLCKLGCTITARELATQPSLNHLHDVTRRLRALRSLIQLGRRDIWSSEDLFSPDLGVSIITRLAKEAGSQQCSQLNLNPSLMVLARCLGVTDAEVLYYSVSACIMCQVGSICLSRVLSTSLSEEHAPALLHSSLDSLSTRIQAQPEDWCPLLLAPPACFLRYVDRVCALLLLEDEETPPDHAVHALAASRALHHLILIRDAFNTRTESSIICNEMDNIFMLEKLFAIIINLYEVSLKKSNFIATKRNRRTAANFQNPYTNWMFEIRYEEEVSGAAKLIKPLASFTQKLIRSNVFEAEDLDSENHRSSTKDLLDDVFKICELLSACNCVLVGVYPFVVVCRHFLPLLRVDNNPDDDDPVSALTTLEMMTSEELLLSTLVSMFSAAYFDLKLALCVTFGVPESILQSKLKVIFKCGSSGPATKLQAASLILSVRIKALLITEKMDPSKAQELLQQANTFSRAAYWNKQFKKLGLSISLNTFNVESTHDQLLASNSVPPSLISSFAADYHLNSQQTMLTLLNAAVTESLASLELPTYTARVTELLHRARQVFQVVRGWPRVSDLLQGLLDRCSPYEYERIHFLLRCLFSLSQDATITKQLELLKLLESYKRTGPVSDYEKSFLTKGEDENDMFAILNIKMPPLVKERLPFHLIVGTDAFKIVSAELNIGTIKFWTRVSNLLNQLSPDSLYMTTAANLIKHHMASVTSNTNPGGDSWRYHGNGQSCDEDDDTMGVPFAQLENLLSNIKDRNKAINCAQSVCQAMSSGPDKLRATELCLSLTRQWIEDVADTPAQQEEVKSSWEARFLTSHRLLATETALKRRQLGRQCYLDLLREPVQLFRSLVKGELRESYLSGTRLSDIHELLEEIANLHEIDLLTVVHDIVFETLRIATNEDLSDLDMTMTMDLRNHAHIEDDNKDEPSIQDFNCIEHLLVNPSLQVPIISDLVDLINQQYLSPRVTFHCHSVLHRVCPTPSLLERRGGVSWQEIEDELLALCWVLRLESSPVPQTFTSFCTVNIEQLTVTLLKASESGTRRTGNCATLAAQLVLDYRVSKEALWIELIKKVNLISAQTWQCLVLPYLLSDLPNLPPNVWSSLENTLGPLLRHATTGGAVNLAPLVMHVLLAYPSAVSRSDDRLVDLIPPFLTLELQLYAYAGLLAAVGVTSPQLRDDTRHKVKLFCTQEKISLDLLVRDLEKIQTYFTSSLFQQFLFSQ